MVKHINQKKDYYSLDIEERYIPYIKTRLPYGFKNYTKRSLKEGKYKVFNPTTEFNVARYNYWLQGDMFYKTGLLLDRAWLLEYVKQFVNVKLGVSKMFRHQVPVDYSEWTEANNLLQLNKIRKYSVGKDHIRRERTLMTYIIHSLELCLKAIQIHVSYREQEKFLFDKGHDIKEMYNRLPESLKDEIEEESKRFPAIYSRHIDKVSSYHELLREHSYKNGCMDERLYSIASDLQNLIEESNYTVFLDGTNSPAPKNEDWFSEALEDCGSNEYFRYIQDDLPTDIIRNGLLLSRFFYEHLFPTYPFLRSMVKDDKRYNL